jgi:hypothetical protein
MKQVYASGMFVAALGMAAACGPALAQPPAPAASAPPPSAQADMAMPDDLGAPLAGAPVDAQPVGRTLSVQTSIAVIAATPQGRAALDRDLPGLCERPEFMMFKGMSPAKLATLSRGRISQSDIDKLQSDLVKVSYTGALPRPHSIFTRSGQAVGRASKAVYHRVALVIASL